MRTAPRIAKLSYTAAIFASVLAIVLETAIGRLDAAARPKRGDVIGPEPPSMVAIIAHRPDWGEMARSIAEHPLFTPGRHPLMAQIASGDTPEVAAITPDWSWRLFGTVVAGDRRIALFSRGTEKSIISQGEIIDGWLVSAIEPDSVTIVAPAYGQRFLIPELRKTNTSPSNDPLLAFSARRSQIPPNKIIQELLSAQDALRAKTKGTLVNSSLPARSSKTY